MAGDVIDIGAFASTIEEMLGNVEEGVVSHAPEAVEKALQKGERAWKTNARAVLSSSYSRGGWGKHKGQVTFKSGPKAGQVRSTKWYGRTIKTGKYARSIRHHMLQGGANPEGEVGSPSMPGLVHLLEKGHAQIGGGYVSGREHVAPAAEEAFADFEKLLEEVIDDAIASA